MASKKLAVLTAPDGTRYVLVPEQEMRELMRQIGISARLATAVAKQRTLSEAVLTAVVKAAFAKLFRDLASPASSPQRVVSGTLDANVGKNDEGETKNDQTQAPPTQGIARCATRT